MNIIVRWVIIVNANAVAAWAVVLLMRWRLDERGERHGGWRVTQWYKEEQIVVRHDRGVPVLPIVGVQMSENFVKIKQHVDISGDEKPSS